MNYLGLELETSDQVYQPCDDSFMLAESVDREVGNNDSLLEIGCGIGIAGLAGARKAKYALLVDVNPQALDLARKNAELNNIGNVSFLESYLFSNIKEKFDLIIFNPPYLPSEEGDKDDFMRAAWDGGPDGRKVVDEFISRVKDYLNPGGRVLLIQSSLNDLKKTEEMFSHEGFETEIVSEKKFFYEILYVIKGRL